MNIIRASCKIARLRCRSYGLGGVMVSTAVSVSMGFLDIIYSRTFFVSALSIDESGISLYTEQRDPNHSWIGDSSP